MIKYKPVNWDENSPTFGQELPEKTIDLGATVTKETVQPQKIAEGGGQHLKFEKVPKPTQDQLQESFEKDAELVADELIKTPAYRESYLDMPDRASELEYIAELVQNPHLRPDEIAKKVMNKRESKMVGDDYLELPVELNNYQKQQLIDKSFENAIDFIEQN